MKPKIILPALLAVSIGLVSTNAAAGPNSSDVDEMFSIFALEGRGFIGTTASLDSPGVAGGDVHLLIEAPSFAVLGGGRFGGDFKDSQLALADIGVRYFPDPYATTSLFAGGGGFYGPEYLNGFQFQTGDIAGVYGEVGVETPRDSSARGTASLRLDLGGAQKTFESRVQPTPVFAVLSLNLGFFLGGEETKRERHHDESVPTPPEEAPIQP
jgi:hypothetical protein